MCVLLNDDELQQGKYFEIICRKNSYDLLHWILNFPLNIWNPPQTLWPHLIWKSFCTMVSTGLIPPRKTNPSPNTDYHDKLYTPFLPLRFAQSHWKRQDPSQILGHLIFRAKIWKNTIFIMSFYNAYICLSRSSL